MKPYVYYFDLINEIELLEYQLNICLAERKDWNFYGRLGNKVRMDQAAENLDRLAEQIEFISAALDKKTSYKKHIEHKLSGFKALEYQVAHLRIVEGMTLEQIAVELDYSVDWIKKVSANITRHFKGTDTLHMMV